MPWSRSSVQKEDIRESLFFLVCNFQVFIKIQTFNEYRTFQSMLLLRYKGWSSTFAIKFLGAGGLGWHMEGIATPKLPRGDDPGCYIKQIGQFCSKPMCSSCFCEADHSFFSFLWTMIAFLKFFHLWNYSVFANTLNIYFYPKLYYVINHSGCATSNCISVVNVKVKKMTKPVYLKEVWIL